MGAFKLGKMTFGSLFKQPETVKYPFEKKPQPAGLKGHIVIDVDRCILCGMCDRSCATNCITVDRKERFWEIQPYQCVQCGYCITVCPKDCLAMDPDYAPAATEMAVTHRDVPEQPKEPREPKEPKEPATAKPADGKKAPAKAEASPAAEKPAEPAPVGGDSQVEALLGLMDPERAEKAKAALS